MKYLEKSTTTKKAWLRGTKTTIKWIYYNT
jgi:hypothetical protein